MEQRLIDNLWQCIGRRDCYAVQLADGTYARVQKPVTTALLTAHVAGELTLGTYVINEQGRCGFAVFDADMENGLAVLQLVQGELAGQGVQLHLERSRRGGHGWLWFDQAYPADQVRAWLSPLAVSYSLELYPKQNAGRGVGSLIRVPLGVHRRSGRRYSFVTTDLQPVASRVSEALTWLPTASRVQVPAAIPGAIATTRLTSPPQKKSFSKNQGLRYTSIREWNASYDPFTIIARYVDLDRAGAGCCPFGSHHAGGRDEHTSFQVYQPHAPGGYCWLCHAGGCGGSLFDFLRLYHGLTAGELWRRLQTGGDVW